MKIIFIFYCWGMCSANGSPHMKRVHSDRTLGQLVEDGLHRALRTRRPIKAAPKAFQLAWCGHTQLILRRFCTSLARRPLFDRFPHGILIISYNMIFDCTLFSDNKLANHKLSGPFASLEGPDRAGFTMWTSHWRFCTGETAPGKVCSLYAVSSVQLLAGRNSIEWIWPKRLKILSRFIGPTPLRLH